MKLHPGSWSKCLIWHLLLFLGLIWAVDLWAAETTPAARVVHDTYLDQFIRYLKTNYTRADWDLTMRWVNFLILAGIIVKYARAPIIGFLKGKRDETARSLEIIEEKKRLAEEKVKEGQIKLKASQDRLKLIQDRIVTEGQRQKEQMITAANQESRIMLESARTKIDSQIRDAYQTIRAELIEAAIDKAMVKLPEMITEHDHQRMIGLWLEEARR